MTAAPRTNDLEIRIALTREMLRLGVPREAILHERTFDTSSSDGRSDMVLALDHALIGIEIKSGRDTLDRLETQGPQYAAHLDRLVLVFDARHEAAARQIGRPWRFKVVAERDGCAGIALRSSGYRRRLADAIGVEIDPGDRSDHTTPFGMLSLLHACEVRAASSMLGGVSARTRCWLIERLGDVHSLAQIRPVVARLLRMRSASLWEIAFWRAFDAAAEAPVSVAAE